MGSHLLFRSSLLLLATGLGTARSAPAQCLDLRTGFEVPGPSDTVWCLVTLDMGSGPALYAGGAFTDVEGHSANHIAKWDGSTWTTLGVGLDGNVRAIIAFDDGTGPAIYVGGDFTSAGGAPVNRVAKWDGSSWSAVGSGVDATVRALTVFDDGTGPALYAGGSFSMAGAVNVNHVAKWNGSAWSDLGGGTDGTVYSLLGFDDGSGWGLEVGGEFNDAGSVPTGSVAKWDGSAWSALGAGPPVDVYGMIAFDDGSGLALHVGGSGVYRWDGSTWSSVGTAGPSCVRTFASFDDGSGPALFTASDQGCQPSIGKWNGSSWSQMSLDPNWRPISIESLSVFDAGSGPSLYLGTQILFSPVSLPLFVARLDGSTWVPVGNADGTTGGVHALASFDDGSGSAVFAGGVFEAAGSTSARHVAKFDGSRWSNLGSGIDGDVRAMTAFDAGSGAALYAGGDFASAGALVAQNIARWDGDQWSPLASGVNGVVDAMIVFDDGTGPALYVGGSFATASGAAVNNIAKWNGSTWSALGVGPAVGTGGTVRCLAVFDDGSGPALCVGGDFTDAGGAPANGVAKWDGSNWAPLGSGLNPAVGGILAFDDGSGPALFAHRSSSLDTGVYKWDGASWTLVGNVELDRCGMASITVFDDGSGPALFACTAQCDKGYPSVFRWDGFQWSYVTSPPTIGDVGTMLPVAGSVDLGPGLYLGSGFPAGYLGAPFSGVARYVGCGHAGVPFCFGDGTGSPCPCGNSGAPGHGCQNSASTGGALLQGSGVGSLSNDTFVLTASGERSSALSIFWQSDVQTPSRAFGDGVGCINTHGKRLYAHRAVAGVVSAPQRGDASVSHASAKMGDPIAPGTSRFYQVFYRDPSPSFCPAPFGSTFNTTNALRTYWNP